MGSSWHRLGCCCYLHLLLLLLYHFVLHWLLGVLDNAAIGGWQHHVTQGLVGCEALWPVVCGLSLLLLAAEDCRDRWCRMQGEGHLVNPESAHECAHARQLLCWWVQMKQAGAVV
jgi:hypothetical protein